jgi:phosphatidylserine/phosphatidylglycerophosphate/cardiolipin synthase-like enzyme
VSNRLPDHAAALYELFFQKASEEVVIFCRNLAPDVFQRSPVQNAFVKALARGVRVRILVQEECEGAKLLNDCGETVALAIDLAHPDDAKLPYNFCVRDKESYRFERDKNSFEAFAKMSHPSEAKTLYDAFEQYWVRRQVRQY